MLTQQGITQYSRCECHDCTQARYKMSFQGQIQSGVIGGSIGVFGNAVTLTPTLTAMNKGESNG